MRETKILVKPFSFLSFLKVEISKIPNEHVSAHVEGIVPEGAAQNYVEKHQDGDPAEIVAVCEDGEKILFYGLIEEIYTEHSNGVDKLCLNLASNTKLLDLKKIKRSYQKDSQTYLDITKIMSSEGSGIYLIPNHESESIRSMLVQYDETDWEFAKRLASRLNTVVIPNYILSKPAVSLGKLERSASHNLASTEYKIKKNMGLFFDNKENDVLFAESSAVSFEVKSRDIMDLCDEVIFMKNRLFVYSILTRLVGSELVHIYDLRLKTGFIVKEEFNKRLVGAEIDGKVTAVRTDQVKVQLDIDQRKCDDKWFPYDTVYSSPDGTGWYFMPEIGDSIRLQLPSEHEEEAHVISAVHVAQNATRSDPDIKSIRTKYGKAFIYEPSATHWTNGHGSTISLIDSQGIKMDTTGDMIIKASGNITFICEENVLIQGDSNVVLDQAGNQVKVDANIDLTAGHVRMR
jgi:phage baseplate assembly protein gpV